MRNASLSLSCTIWLGACATAPAAPVPTPPKVETKAPPSLTLSIASGATKLSVACAQAENPVSNGIDDDCDGRVDQVDVQRSALHIALVHTSDVDVRLSLSTEAPSEAPTQHATAEHVCDGSVGFAVQHIDVTRLEPGRYDLTLVRAEACGKDNNANISASLWVEGKAQGVYAFALKPGESTQLGRLDVK